MMRLGTLPRRKPGTWIWLPIDLYAASRLGLSSSNGTSTVSLTLVGPRVSRAVFTTDSSSGCRGWAGHHGVLGRGEPVHATRACCPLLPPDTDPSGLLTPLPRALPTLPARCPPAAMGRRPALRVAGAHDGWGARTGGTPPAKVPATGCPGGDIPRPFRESAGIDPSRVAGAPSPTAPQVLSLLSPAAPDDRAPEEVIG